MAPMFRAEGPLLRRGVFDRTRLVGIVVAAAVFAGAATLVGNFVLKDGSGPFAGPSSEESPRLTPDELRDGTTVAGGEVTREGALHRLVETAARFGSAIADTAVDVVTAVASTARDISRGVIAAARETGGKVINAVLGVGEGAASVDRDVAGVADGSAAGPLISEGTLTPTDTRPEVKPDKNGALRPGSTSTGEDVSGTSEESTDASDDHPDETAGASPTPDETEQPVEEPEESPSPDSSESPSEEPSPAESPSGTPDEEPSGSPSESPSP